MMNEKVSARVHARAETFFGWMAFGGAAKSDAASGSRRWMSGNGSLSKVYNLNELRPHAKKPEKASPKKQGRIIR